METYNFDADATFQQGVASIVARMSAQQQPPDAVAQAVEDARGFYYRKYVQPTAGETPVSLETSGTTDTNAGSSQPAYPKTFAEICASVARGEPVAGIRLIPTTVHDRELASAPRAAMRRKPWEAAVQPSE
ncbi:hypothetical protein BC830DRAFT_1174119 [Chytriomyces sp. MP71]|nr:hypothetical protein BC830DRAFT_1174119 [Chytriomyces sp. MP71]